MHQNLMKFVIKYLNALIQSITSPFDAGRSWIEYTQNWCTLPDKVTQVNQWNRDLLWKTGTMCRGVLQPPNNYRYDYHDNLCVGWSFENLAALLPQNVGNQISLGCNFKIFQGRLPLKTHFMQSPAPLKSKTCSAVHERITSLILKLLIWSLNFFKQAQK